MSYQISTPISKVLEDVLAGKPVVLLDDEDRENEGDLFVATDRATEESIAFMMQYGRGLVCISIGRAVAERLRLPLQVIENRSKFKTAFTVSVDAKDVGQTGVTAKSRVFTMKKIIDPNSCPEDFVSPGHVFPLIANPAGVLGRHGQTEGSFDLARAAGLTPSGIICEILSNEGGMERGASLSQFALNHGLSITTVGDVIRYRVKEEILVREVADSTLATAYGNFKTIVFQDDVEGKEHLVLIKGDLGKGAPLLRIHSECLTGDVFGSRRCDCGEQLDIAVQSICREGSGIIIYLRQEGRGIGLLNKLKAYALQDEGHDTVEANLKLGFQADERDYFVAAQILSALKVSKVRLLTNNPDKIKALERSSITVTERIPVIAAPDECSESYLETKKTKLGHLL